MPLSAITGPSVLSAVPTIFDSTGKLDQEGNTRVFDHVAASDVDALMVAGTTGEFPALDDGERITVIELALQAAGPDRVVAHVGAASAHQAAALTRSAVNAGCRYIAALTPYYLTGSAGAIEQYFAQVVAAAGSAKVYGYLFPALTGVHLTPDVVAGIILRTGLAGAKLSIPGVDYLAKLVRLLPSEMHVWSGNDSLLPQVVANGGRGIVSGVSPILPQLFADQAAALRETDLAALAVLSPKVDQTVAAIGPSVTYLKSALRQAGLISSDFCRLALDPPSAEDQAAIRTIVDTLPLSASTPAA